MTDAVLVGRGDAISSIARSDWEQGLSSAPQTISRPTLTSTSPEDCAPDASGQVPDGWHLPRPHPIRV